MFQRNLLPPSSVLKTEEAHSSETSGTHLPKYMASYERRKRIFKDIFGPQLFPSLALQSSFT
jgi:hypothetical protein